MSYLPRWLDTLDRCHHRGRRRSRVRDSVGTQARHAAMSRSSFAETFRREIGQTPSEYLTCWRITVVQALGVTPSEWLRKR